MATRCERTFHQRYTGSKQHMKTCSILLANREIQTNTSCDITTHPWELLKLKRLTTPQVYLDVEQLELSYNTRNMNGTTP